MTKVIDTVSEVLDDVFGDARIARKETDARVTEVLGQVGDGLIDGDRAWFDIVLVLHAIHGGTDTDGTHAAATEILNAVRVPFEVKELAVA